eukprot:scaffold74423_cov27-Tisochrysis_lutea.AAC.3
MRVSLFESRSGLEWCDSTGTRFFVSARAAITFPSATRTLGAGLLSSFRAGKVHQTKLSACPGEGAFRPTTKN